MMNRDDNQEDDSMEFEFETVDERSAHEGGGEADDSLDMEDLEDVEDLEDLEDLEGLEDLQDAAGGAQQQSRGAAQGQPSQEAVEQMMADLDIYAVLRMMIGMVAEQAWISLGLRVPEGAEEPQTDLDEARVAIDTLQFIQGKLEPQLEAEENRELETLISDLQMNFVEKSE